MRRKTPNILLKILLRVDKIKENMPTTILYWVRVIGWELGLGLGLGVGVRVIGWEGPGSYNVRQEVKDSRGWAGVGVRTQVFIYIIPNKHPDNRSRAGLCSGGTLNVITLPPIQRSAGDTKFFE